MKSTFFCLHISRTNSAITDSGFLSQSSLSSPGSRLLQTSSTGSLNKLPGVSGADKINLLNGGSYKATGGLDNKLVVSCNIFYGNYGIFYCNYYNVCSCNLIEFLCDYFRTIMLPMPKMELEDLPEISWIRTDLLRFLEKAGVLFTLPDIPTIHFNILLMIIQKLSFKSMLEIIFLFGERFV